MNRASTEIRAGVAADHPALTALARRAKAAWGYPPEWLALWQAELRFTPASMARQQVWVAEREGVAVAVIALEAHEDAWEIEHLWVDPDHWGEGLGGDLLSHALADLGGTRVIVVSDPNAIGFYQHQGFEQTGWLDSRPPGRRLPVLERQLEASSA